MAFQNTGVYRQIAEAGHLSVERMIELILLAGRVYDDCQRSGMAFSKTANIGMAFNWANTTEGHAFWSNVSAELEQRRRPYADRPQPVTEKQEKKYAAIYE